MKTNAFILTLLLSMLTVACGGKKNSDVPDVPPTPGKDARILIATSTNGVDGSSGTAHLHMISGLEDKIDDGKGVQVGWATGYYVYGNEVYTMPTMFSVEDRDVRKYTLTSEGKLSGPLKFLSPEASNPMNFTKISDEKAYLPCYTIPKVIILNPKTMKQIGEIDITKYAHKDNCPDPGAGILRDGIYYLPLDQIDGKNWMPYEDHLQCDVLVIDTKTDKVIKMTSEDKSGLSFPTRPFLGFMSFQTEQKDLYFAALGFFGFRADKKDCGFICIPSGSQDVDISRTWNIKDTSVEGEPYKPAAIFNARYIGNGLVACYVGFNELNSSNPYTARNGCAVIADLKNKTLKRVPDVPYTDGHSVFIETHKGKVYFSAYGEKASGVWEYDPTTHTTKQVMKSNLHITYLHFF